MEKDGLEELHVDVRRLIDASSNPASPEAQRVAERYLKFCEAQFISDPAPFAQLLSQYPNPERGDADVRRAQWEFIAKAVHVRGICPGHRIHLRRAATPIAGEKRGVIHSELARESLTIRLLADAAEYVESLLHQNFGYAPADARGRSGNDDFSSAQLSPHNRRELPRDPAPFGRRPFALLR